MKMAKVQSDKYTSDTSFNVIFPATEGKCYEELH